MSKCYQKNIIDCSKRYCMDMQVKGTQEQVTHKDVEFKCFYINDKSGFIRLQAEGYDDKLMYEEFFSWLLYTGKIKEIKNNI